MIRALLAVLGLQFLVVCMTTLVFLLTSGLVVAKSAAVGGAIALIPGAFYAWRITGSRNLAPERVLRVHFAAEAGKLALTFVLFASTFAWMKDVSVLPLFAAYIAALMAYWVALLVFKQA